MVDTRALALLRPANGKRHLRLPRKEQQHETEVVGERPRSSRRSRSAPATALEHQQVARPRSSRAPSAARSSIVGIWTGAERRRSQAVIEAFNEEVPEASRQLQADRRQRADRALDRGRRRQSARHGVGLAAGPRQGLPEEGRAEADRLREVRRSPRTSPGVVVNIGTINGKHLRRSSVKGAQQVDRLVQRARLQGRRRRAAEDLGRSSSKRDQHAEGVGHRRRSRSAARTAGRSPTCSRTSTSAQAGAAKYDALTTHKIKWTDPSVTKALKTMGQVLGDSGNIAGGTSGALQTDFTTPSRTCSRARPKAAMVFEGDFVAGVIVSSNDREAGDRLQRLRRSRRSHRAPRGAVESGGDLLDDVQGHPGDRGVRQVPRDRAGGRGVGEARRVLVAEQERRRVSVYPDAITRATAARARHGEGRSVFDMSDLQPASFGAHGRARASSRSSRTS